MRKRFVDPFFPGRPVDDPARFSGRDEQVDEVVDALYQLRSGQPRNCIITGDRGIGKSSLLLQAKLLAEGNNALPERLGLDTGVDAFDFAVGWHDADPGQGPRELVEGLLSDFQTRSGKLLAKIKIEVSIGSVLTVSEKEGASSLSSLVRKFCEQVAKLEELVDRHEKDGVIFFIDELDRAAPDRGVATFFKLATERLNRDGIHHVGFMGAGITGAVQALEEEHGSIFRTLRDIPLPRLTKTETEEILTSGFETAGFEYEKAVAGRVFAVSGGFPEPVHMLGSEMLSVDSDGRITWHDFEAAKTKVITDVRRNKLHSILKDAGSGKYQRILEAMANHEAPDVPLDIISEALGLQQNQYSTNMSTLVERGVLHRSDRGVYCFVDPLLKEYIRHFGVISVDTVREEDE